MPENETTQPNVIGIITAEASGTVGQGTSPIPIEGEPA